MRESYTGTPEPEYYEATRAFARGESNGANFEGTESVEATRAFARGESIIGINISKV